MPEMTPHGFISMLKGMEGLSLHSYSDVGRRAIGYGHNVQPGENIPDDITQERANELLNSDVQTALKSARRAVPQIQDGADFEQLPPASKYKLMERAFNQGPNFHKKAPKWSSAVVAGDVQTELNEFQRHSNGIPLKRNDQYIDFFHPGLSGRDAVSRDKKNQGSQETASRPLVVGGGKAEGAGDLPPSAMEETFSDPEFQQLSPAQQVEKLATTFPRFKQLYEANPEAAKAFADRHSSQSNAELDDPDFWSSLRGGFRIGVGSAAYVMANVADLIEKLGIENDYDESWRKFANIQFLDGGNQIGSDWYDIVGSVVAGLPGGLVIPAAATAAFASALPESLAIAAPALGFGIVGAVGAEDRGAVAAAKAGFTDAAIGAMFPAIQHLSRATRAALVTGASYVASDQEDPHRRFLESAVMGVLGGAPGRRAPAAVMEKLGVENKYKTAALALKEAKRESAHNVATASSLEIPVTDAYGNQIESLGAAIRTYGEMVRSQHPMTSRPMDRSPWERGEISKRHENSNAEQGAIALDAAPDRRSSRFSPGPDWIDNRAFTVSEGPVAKLVKGYKKAREILEPLAKAFEIPFHEGRTQNSLKGASGSYTFLKKFSDGRTINPQRLEVLKGSDIQTVAHEFGHHVSFTDKTLSRFHDPRSRGFREDLEALDNLASSHNAGPDEVIGPDGKTDKRYSGIVTKDGRATVSGIFKLDQDGLVPENLKYIVEQLRVSYDHNNVTEGMAEMFRLWLTNNKKYGGEVDFPRQFPKMERILESWKDRLPSRRRKSIEKFQKEAEAHLSANGATAMSAALGSDGDPSSVLSSRAMSLRQKGFDDMAGVMNLVMRSNNGTLIPDSVYETMRNLRGIADIQTRIMKWGAPGFIVDPVNGGRMLRFSGKGLEEILLPVSNSAGELNRALRYLVARQAKELKIQYVDPKDGRVKMLSELPELERRRVVGENRTREQRLSDNEITDSLKLADGHPEYEDVFRDLHKFAEKMADFGQEAGLWSSEQRGKWQRTQFLFSFFRDMEARKRTGVRSASILTGEEPTKTLRGSQRNLRDPFENLLETHTRTIKLALENIAKQELMAFSLRAEGGGRFGEILRPIPDMRDLNMGQIRAAAATELERLYPQIKALGIVDQIVEKNFPTTGDLEKITMFMGNNKPHGENVMTVFVGGKPKYFDIQDPLLIQSVMAIRRPQLFGVAKMFNGLRRFKQHMITIAPGFIASNFVRDVAMSSIMSRTGNFHLGKALKGMWGAIKEDQDYQDMVANGGGAAGINEPHAVTMRKVVAFAQRKGFNPKRLLIDSVNVFKFLDEIGRVVEVSSRLGEYKAARVQGARAQHAAFMSREVSTDFSMRGDARAMQMFSNIVPFLSAMVAGGDRLYRSVRYDPSHKMATAIKIGGVAMASGALYGLNRKIPEYNDLDNWDKWGYWHFFVPAWSDDGHRDRYKDGDFAGQLAHHHFKIPKLWEVGSVGSLFERFLESLGSSDSDEDQDMFLDMLQIVGNNFGLNLADRGVPLPVPVGADVVLEQMTGKILYTGNPIESGAMANLESWQRARPTSPKIFSKYGELMRHFPGAGALASPARAEALLRGVFGEFAMIGAHVADSIFFPGGPAMRTDNLPIVSRFYEGQGKYSKQEGLFYERLKDFRQAEATKRELATNPAKVHLLKDWISDPDKQRSIALASHFDRLSREVSALRKNQELILSGVTPLSPAEARHKIDVIEAHIRDIMRVANDLDSAMKRRGRQ